jgi:hypothetical protein
MKNVVADTVNGIVTAIVLSLSLSACPQACSSRSATPPVAPLPPRDEPTQTDGETPVLSASKPDPRAEALCQTLHGLPAERRAGCCDNHAVSLDSTIETQCVEVISALLERKQVLLSPERLAGCEAAQQRALDGCSWVRPLATPAVDACQHLLVGTLQDGARCASSLECQDGLRCHGASALSFGRCGKPKRERMPCGAAIDPLAFALGGRDLDAHHPECEGQCVLGRCSARSSAAKAKVARVMAAEGETCANDFDCLEGGCVKAAAASTGVCGMKCRAL